jgi:hypothetical protein
MSSNSETRIGKYVLNKTKFCKKTFPFSDNLNIVYDKINEIASDIEEYIKKQSILKNYSHYQQSAFLLRGNLIEWIFSINYKLQGGNETFFSAVNIMDMFFMRNFQEIKKDSLSLIAAMCYFIAFKVEETHSMSLQLLKSGILKDKYSEKEIIQSELKILKTLNFKIYKLSTVNNFTNLFTEFIKEKNMELFEMRFGKNFLKLLTFVDSFSLLVQELIFELEPIKISLINFHTSLLLLKHMRLLKADEFTSLVAKIKRLLTNFLQKYYKDITFYEDIISISESLLEVILDQSQASQRRSFFILFDEFFSS